MKLGYNWNYDYSTHTQNNEIQTIPDEWTKRCINARENLNIFYLLFTQKDIRLFYWRPTFKRESVKKESYNAEVSRTMFLKMYFVWHLFSFEIKASENVYLIVMITVLYKL